MTLSIDLKNRNVLITGASSGLGAHFSHLLASAGANVAICARRKAKLDKLAEDLKTYGNAVSAIEMDVQSEDSIIAGFDAAASSLGSVDTVIVNAGMNNEGMATSISADEFSGVLSVNLTGAFLTAREGAKRMMSAGSAEREHGRIILISSITANKVDAGLAAYSASKSGALQMGKVMAREWARHGICVNIVCPGYIETDINRDWFQTDLGQKQIKKWPRRRLMQKTDMDHMIALLSSDHAKGITGSVFTLDDGQSL